MICIPLTQGKHAIIDNDDWELVSGYNWRLTKPVRGIQYATVTVGKKGHRHSLRMHHLIVGKPPKGFDVDHIDGDTMNNTRANLRVCTHAQNCQNSRTRSDNTSGYRGVYLHKQSGLWHARIHANGVKYSLQYHETPELAYEAYCKAAVKLHGEFARIST